MKNKIKYLLLYLFIALYVYNMSNGEYIDTKRSHIVNEFYTGKQYEGIQVTVFHTSFMTNGTYMVNVQYDTNGSGQVSLDNYKQFLINNSWIYEKQLLDSKTNLVIGNSFTKDRIKLEVYISDNVSKQKKVSEVYFYEKN